MNFHVLLMVIGALPGLGCAARLPEESGGSALSPRTVGWRLTQRSYGTSEASWAHAGFATIAGECETLVFEAIHERHAAPSPSVTAILRTSIPAIAFCATGDVVRVRVWIEGSKDRTYVIRIDPTSAKSRIRQVEGATPLAGEPGRWLFAAGEKADVSFTSEESGLSGLRIELVGEIAVPVVLSSTRLHRP